MPVFRVRLFFGMVGFAAFALVFCSVGIRWHVYRAQASIYARRELEHTFEALHYARAARMTGGSDEDQAQAASYRNLARMHEKAARECTRFRELYENSW
jgi:hypothetical protein